MMHKYIRIFLDAKILLKKARLHVIHSDQRHSLVITKLRSKKGCKGDQRKYFFWV